ncbi:MAG: hypothetical protein K6G30_14055 [Acetatifactor sp.]|nr:hypothetical protein [Acetatifactor sp.]
MKRKKNDIRPILIICVALGWWGMLYPELTLTPQTCVVRQADGTAVDAEKMQAIKKDLYQMILEADRSHIRFKSKLAESRKKWTEKLP